ncbi:glycoside hydrolase family 65 protein [Alistipes sp.]|uniref:glycoside hydrolase family 65 protein n=1 Tax=Alistipes sp. TaxID=1872444 RepID=UPI0025C2A591|nr:glycoside hydrolase family 65 protein [Alistipes sp.]
MIKIVFLVGLLAIIPQLADAHSEGSEGWVITARDTTADYFAVAMANGEIGVTVGREPFSLGPVILGESYEPGSKDDVSRILEGINPMGLTMAIDGRRFNPLEVRPQHQSVDMRRAVHTTCFSTDGVTVVCRIRALRNMPYALMTEVEVTAERDAELLFSNNHSIPETLTDTLRESRTVACEDGSRIALQRTSGSYGHGLDHIAVSSTFLCSKGCEQVTPGCVKMILHKGSRAAFSLVGTICTTSTFTDPWNESERQAIYAVREGVLQLVAAHEQKWAELWQGDIEIEGDPTAQLDIRFALFNLYSSIREGSRRSIPPMGLSTRGFYNGHIFWDSEIWMYPTLLVLQPSLAQQMLNYRIDGLNAARRRAYAHGYRGAMFPWEGDARGEEATPTFALTGPLEHHITADIAIACWNYFCVTQDQKWLCREGFPLMREVALFWCDRATANADGSYSIRNVIGANEYAVGVTDNAFTNGAVRRALEYTTAAAELCSERPNPQWSVLAEGLRIPHFADGTTREHADYNGKMIKQADANLLGYPLGIVTEREALLRDLKYYEHRIDPHNGPAMSYSVFAIQYARLGMVEKAGEMFRRSYLPNLRPPFRVFAETATSGNPYFMTGAGGMLQAVLFGFGGLEITPDGLIQRPSILPRQWKNLKIKINGKIFQTAKQ